MVIVTNNIDEITVKIPNNLTKSSNILILKHTENKKEFRVEFEDQGLSDLFYVFDYVFSGFPLGEYEYEIDGNRGLLRIGDQVEKKIYNSDITFKAYGE